MIVALNSRELVHKYPAPLPCSWRFCMAFNIPQRHPTPVPSEVPGLITHCLLAVFLSLPHFPSPPPVFPDSHSPSLLVLCLHPIVDFWRNPNYNAPCTTFLGLLWQVPDTGWLKTAEIYFLKFWRLKSLKSRCWQGHTFWQLLRKILSFLF